MLRNINATKETCEESIACNANPLAVHSKFASVTKSLIDSRTFFKMDPWRMRASNMMMRWKVTLLLSSSFFLCGDFQIQYEFEITREKRFKRTKRARTSRKLKLSMQQMSYFSATVDVMQSSTITLLSLSESHILSPYTPSRFFPRRVHERPIYSHLLVQHQLPVHVLDRTLRLFLLFILNQTVSLNEPSSPV